MDHRVFSIIQLLVCFASQVNLATTINRYNYYGALYYCVTVLQYGVTIVDGKRNAKPTRKKIKSHNMTSSLSGMISRKTEVASAKNESRRKRRNSSIGYKTTMVMLDERKETATEHNYKRPKKEN